MEDSDDETLVLGGNIQLTGFREIDRPSMVVVKKMVGNYVKRLSGMADKFERMHIVLKPIHVQESNKKYELHAKMLDNGKAYTSEIVDKNLFFALDSVLAKIESTMKR